MTRGGYNVGGMCVGSGDVRGNDDDDNKYPLGTTMRPRLAVVLTDKQILWAFLKHFVTFEVVLQ